MNISAVVAASSTTDRQYEHRQYNATQLKALGLGIGIVSSGMGIWTALAPAVCFPTDFGLGRLATMGAMAGIAGAGLGIWLLGWKMGKD